MKRLIFGRHGNTFNPDDSVVWVGSGTDLPLVAKGREQAHAAAKRLQQKDVVPARLWAASLKRTTEFAQIVCDDLGLPAPRIDSRLDEIHYGAWEGATTEEIAADPDRAKALALWQDADVWPDCLGWRTTQNQVMANLAAVFADIGAEHGDETVMIVSSNGILRFAPRVLGIAEPRSFRLKTGALGGAERREGAWRILFWE
jgi:probable phosphoglycerate mutase